MNPQDQSDFLKRPRLDMLNRHKRRRLEIAECWLKARDVKAIGPLVTVAYNRDDDMEVREGAIIALGAIGGNQAASALTKLLHSPAEQQFHMACIQGLRQIGDSRSISALIAGLESTDDHEQEAIGRAIIEIGPQRTVEMLLSALGHQSENVRRGSRRVLAQYGGINQQLIAALGNTNDSVRSGAGDLLAEQGKAAVPDLMSILNSDKEHQSQEATRVLQMVGKPAVDGLVEVLCGTDERASQNAGKALVGIGALSVAPLLQAAVNDNRASGVLKQMRDITIEPLIDALDDDAMQDIATSLLIETGEPVMHHLFECLDSENNDLLIAIVRVMQGIRQQDVTDIAMSFYRQCVTTEWKNAIGIKLSELGKAAPFIKWARRIIHLDPEFALAHYALGWNYINQERPELAQNHFQKALKASHRNEMDGKEGGCYLGLGKACLDSEEKRYEEAIAYLEKAVEMKAAEPRLYGILTDAYIETATNYLKENNNLDQVVPLLKKAMAAAAKHRLIFPDDQLLSSVQNFEIMFSELDNVDLYREAYVQRLRGAVCFESFKNFNLLSTLAQSSGKAFSTDERRIMNNVENISQQDAQATIDAFSEALRLKPDYVQARHNLGNAFALMGRYQEAAGILEQGIRLSPEYWPIFDDLAKIYMNNLNDNQKAIRVLKEAERFHPNESQLHFMLGGLLSATGRNQDAIKSLQ
ncbi:MAG: HEAT repeat domain-containing protein, partial [Anaerolineales bacterium]|nr:HEAT repeat domain-containing protein [Anaerolineales bacterium]